MKIRDIMTKNVEPARPEEPVQSVAQRMARGDFGFAPVCEGKKVIGTVTDRDLAIRVLAGGMPATTPVAEVMTREVSYAFAEDRVEEVLEKMSREQIRRLPIVDENRELVGVVSLGDLSSKVKERFAGEALEDISKPRGTQTFS